MNIFSYKNNDSALLRHLQAIKQKQIDNALKIKNPLLSVNKHNFAAKSTMKDRNKGNNFMSKRVSSTISSPKNSLFFPKQKTNIKYSEKYKNKRKHLREQCQTQQFFQVTSLKPDIQQKNRQNKSIQIGWFDQIGLQDKFYPSSKLKKTFRIKTEPYDPQAPILKVSQIDRQCNRQDNIKNRVQSASNARHYRRKSLNMKSTRQNFKRNNTQNLEIEGWITKDIMHDNFQYF